VRLTRIIVLVVSTFLLVSMGGAIFAAPLTVPLLVIAARSTSSIGYRVWAGFVLVATVAEVAWAVTYVAVRESQPAIWLVPLLAALATVVGYVRLLNESRSARPLAT
jgi:hypothetical protein